MSRTQTAFELFGVACIILIWVTGWVELPL